jgi:hypothetical protein
VVDLGSRKPFCISVVAMSRQRSLLSHCTVFLCTRLGMTIGFPNVFRLLSKRYPYHKRVLSSMRSRANAPHHQSIACEPVTLHSEHGRTGFFSELSYVDSCPRLSRRALFAQSLAISLSFVCTWSDLSRVLTRWLSAYALPATEVVPALP